MARSVGDIIVSQIGALSIERANALARAETAEELLALPGVSAFIAEQKKIAKKPEPVKESE